MRGRCVGAPGLRIVWWTWHISHLRVGRGFDQGARTRQLYEQFHHVVDFHLSEGRRGRGVHQCPHGGQKALLHHLLMNSGSVTHTACQSPLSTSFPVEFTSAAPRRRTCSRESKAGRRRRGSAAAWCRPRWRGYTTAAPVATASLRSRCGRCTSAWKDPRPSPCAGRTPGQWKESEDESDNRLNRFVHGCPIWPESRQSHSYSWAAGTADVLLILHNPESSAQSE